MRDKRRIVGELNDGLLKVLDLADGGDAKSRDYADGVTEAMAVVNAVLAKRECGEETP